jgi:hypothetical protein
MVADEDRRFKRQTAYAVLIPARVMGGVFMRVGLTVGYEQLG